jgi:predicted GNAT family acetyltransferase
MDVRHEGGESKGTFFVEKDGARAGWMTYSRAGETTIIIDHTEVSPALRGTGAGKKMVEAAVAQARRDGLKIIPLCPFAASVFAKDAALADVLST